MLWNAKKKKLKQLVHGSASPADLAGVLILEIDEGHARQCIAELLRPLLPDLRVQSGCELGLLVGEESLVRREEHAPGESVVVVVVVHHEGRDGIQEHRGARVCVCSGAGSLQLSCVCGIESWVDPVGGSWEVVEAIGDLVAMGDSNCMRTCIWCVHTFMYVNCSDLLQRN